MPSTLIDLTHLLNGNITVYPDTLRPRFDVLHTVEKNGFAELQATMALHAGTHIDAPCHTVQGAKSIDRFPIEKFSGNAIVISCRDQKEISLNYLRKFEVAIAMVDFILFYTGWQQKWNTSGYFENCPIPTTEAAAWLASFNLKGIGVDAFSLDNVYSAKNVLAQKLPNHQIFLEKEILLIENLTNLDKLPVTPFRFQCFPLNIEHADGSLVRAVATITSEVNELPEPI